MVPIILLTGFLGAGKTTFLNWLLKNNPEVKISIILNEFGDTHLETQFVKQQTGNVVELANGCMCCVAKSDIPRVISFILANSPQTEYILIEASGLSDPDPVHEALKTPPVSTSTNLESTICIVDAVNFETMRTQNAIITSQIADSDLVIISKVTEAGNEKVERVTTILRNLTPDVRVLSFTDDIPSSIFLTKTIPVHSEKPVDPNQSHVHEEYQTIIFESEQVLQFEKVVDILGQLPDTIIRIKGVAQCQNNQAEMFWAQIQKVGSRFSVDEYTPTTPAKTTILCVGKEIDEQDLLNKLKNCQMSTA